MHAAMTPFPTQHAAERTAKGSQRQKLTLIVDATDDLDLGDLADWASARLVR